MNYSLIKDRQKKSGIGILKGVTLLEILVAMVVLTGGLFMLYNIFPKGFAASYRSKNQTIATQLAQGKIEEILQNKAQVACNTNGCIYRVPDANLLLPPGENTSDGYNLYSGGCEHHYSNPGDHGVSGSIRLGTLCPYHMGVVDNLSSWQQFPDNPWFWYHIQVVPVLDPSSNIAAQPRRTLYRDFGSCSRLTVRVRGPIDTMASWNTAQSHGGTRLPAEVVLTTYVANKYIANSIVDTGGSNANIPVTRNNPAQQYLLHVINVRNFVFFNTLTHDEVDRNTSWVFHVNSAGSFPTGSEETSSVLHRRHLSYFTYNGSGNYPEPAPYNKITHAEYTGNYGPYYMGNNLGLDNVIIVRRDSVDGTFDNGNDRLLVQTNKLIGIFASAGTPLVQNKPGVLYIQQPLYYNKIPEHSMIKCYVADCPPEGLVQDFSGPWTCPMCGHYNEGGTECEACACWRVAEYNNPTLRWFTLFTDARCTPDAWTAYYMNYSTTRGPTPAMPYIPPPFPSGYGYSTVSGNRAVRYEVHQFVCPPRQNGASLDVF